jgi:hypothetical protein
MLNHLEGRLFARRRLLSLTANGRLGPRSEELHALRYDLGSLALAAAILVLEFVGSEPPSPAKAATPQFKKRIGLERPLSFLVGPANISA